MFRIFRNRLSFLFLICFCSLLGNAFQFSPDRIRFHDMASDTTRVNEILVSVLKEDPGTPGTRIETIGRMFIDTPYVAHTLEVDSGYPEILSVNISELDCTTFVETVAALAKTVGEGRSSWRDFIYNLENLRYRSGEMDGYSSRLHYIADWVVDNGYRGNIKDVTNTFPKVNYITKSINFMSSNRDKYRALSDSTQFERIKSIENGYRNHRFPYIKTLDLNDKSTKKSFRTGDIVALTTSLKNLDVTHMGIVILVNGEPYLLHASSSLGKVVITQVPLAEFMRRNRSLTGLRVLRLLDE